MILVIKQHNPLALHLFGAILLFISILKIKNMKSRVHEITISCTFVIQKMYIMKRIQLGAPYDDFIQKMIDSGYYSSTTEALRDALRKMMKEVEADRYMNIKMLLEEGESSLVNEPALPFNSDFVKKAKSRAKEIVKANKPIPNYLRP
jgi:putative addiction module CopG family antidote